jgi:hypothetical protein
MSEERHPALGSGGQLRPFFNIACANPNFLSSNHPTIGERVWVTRRDTKTALLPRPSGSATDICCRDGNASTKRVNDGSRRHFAHGRQSKDVQSPEKLAVDSSLTRQPRTPSRERLLPRSSKVLGTAAECAVRVSGRCLRGRSAKECHKRGRLRRRKGTGALPAREQGATGGRG